MVFYNIRVQVLNCLSQSLLTEVMFVGPDWILGRSISTAAFYSAVKEALQSILILVPAF
jgi:hypothetical protein